MNLEKQREINRLFLECCDLEPEERSRFLDGACAARPDVRAEVEALLSADEKLFEHDAARRQETGDGVDQRDREHRRPYHPETIGPYKVLEVLGEGGMGIVYLAEQRQPIRRRVAVKVIQFGMSSREVVARFEAERQAIALMDHATIARVYEAGTAADGRPYFVMEYVQGVPITTYCDRNRLDVRARLELFQQVCRGVNHAHLKGIIHRDLKPSNVLVATADGKPLAKIIDFGVAKATNQRLTEKTLYTELGRVVGTPSYMSPEQAERSAEDVDHRTDIYSLGVLLYELLVGELPIDREIFRDAAFDEVVRRIRDDDPPPPSTRWSRLSVEKTNRLARERDTSASGLRQRLRGDLDWIVMKAIEKERARRYASAQELADDIQRHLDEVPVLARSPSALYRMKRLARRHRGPVTVLAAVFLALATGAIVSFVFYLKAIESAEDADARRADAERAKADVEIAKAEVDRALAEARWQTYVGNISAAAFYLEAGNAAEARRRLEACPEELRAWEWYHFDHRRDVSSRRLPGHRDVVASVDFSPDGARIVSGSWDGTVRLWDRETGRELRVWRDHRGHIHSVDWSPDGRWIASGGNDRVVRLCDPGSDSSRSLGRHDHSIWSVAFAPDGRWLVSADRTLKVWEVNTGKPLASLTGHGEPAMGLTFGPRGDRLYSSTSGGTLRIWDTTTWSCLETIIVPQIAFLSVSVSPGGERVAAGTRDGQLMMWDTTTFQPTDTIRTRDPAVRLAIFHPHRPFILTGCRALEAWDSRTLQLGTTLHGHEDVIPAAAFSRDGESIVSGSWDGEIRVWDARAMEGQTTLLGVVVALSDRWIASGSSDGLVRLWNAADGLPVGTTRHDGAISAVAFSAGGDLLASASDDRTIRIWNLESGVIRVLRSDARVGSVAFSPDDDRLVSSHVDRGVRIWKVGNDRPLLELKNGASEALGVAFSADGKRVACGFGDARIRVWDATTGELLHTLHGHANSVFTVAFNPDGDRLVSGSRDRTLRLWNPLSGKSLGVLPGHEQDVLSAVFTPDGSRIVSGSRDHTVRIWDPETRLLLVTLRGHETEVASVAVSPDGRRIASGSWDRERVLRPGRVRLWESERAAATRMWHAAERRREAIALGTVLQPRFLQGQVNHALRALRETATKILPDGAKEE